MRATDGSAGAGGLRPASSWQVRAGWLLRSSRMHGPDAELRSAAVFARRCAEGPVGGVNRSTVSRWESGQLPVTRSTVRAYEQLLGLIPFELVTAIETNARYQGGAAAEAFARSAVPPAAGPRDRVDILLDKALDDELLSGDEWDELTLRLTASPAAMSPGRVRRAVTDRLLEETLVSAGVPWMRRFESLGRLLAHPYWAPDAIASCADVGTDASHAGLIEAVCALDGSRHPDANRHVLRQLRTPTTEDSFHGAVLACVRKTRRHHFGTAQQTPLLDVMSDLLIDGAARPESAEAAAVVLPHLTVPPAHLDRLRRAAETQPTIHHVIRHRRLVAPDTADVTVTRLLARMPMDADPPAVTAVLRELIDELLHHPAADMRLYTGMLLRASPYRAALAAALAAELRHQATLQAVERSVPILHALRVVGTSGQRAAVARLTVVDGLPRPVTRAAIHALGHIGGHSPEPYWRAVLRRHTDLWSASGTAPSDGELKRLVYGFAMAGELDLLARLLAEQGPASPVAPLIRYWTALPSHIMDSARA